jgi:hypothetical protein
VSSAPEDRPPPHLSEEEAEFRAAREKLVDWVRVEPSRLFLRSFLPSLLFVPIGGTLVGMSMGGRWVDARHGLWLVILGLVCTALGPMWALFSLIRAMGQDTYVAIRLDGLAVRLEPHLPEALYPWDELSDARPEARERAVIVTLVSGQIVRLSGPFTAISETEFAARIRDARRLALWHRLSPESLAIHAHDRE